MSAGLPGLGLGGLFFLVSALLAPLVELVRTARGESSLASWLGVGRQFGLAVAMIVAVDGVLRLVYLLGSVAGLGDGSKAGAITALPVVPLLLALSLVALVLAGAKGMELEARTRAGEFAWIASAGRLPTRSDIVGGVAALTVVWLALLAVGASTLGTPLAALGPSFGGGDGGGKEAVADDDGRETPRAEAAPQVAERPLPELGDSTRGKRGGERSGRGAGGRKPSAAGRTSQSAQAGSSATPAPGARGPGGEGGSADGGGQPVEAGPPAAPPSSGQGQPGGAVSGGGGRPADAGPPSTPGSGSGNAGGGGSGSGPGSGNAGGGSGAARGSPPATMLSGRDVPVADRRSSRGPASRTP